MIFQYFKLLSNVVTIFHISPSSTLDIGKQIQVPSVENPDVKYWRLPFIHIHYHLFHNREGRWGTTDDFATSFLHFPLFFTALWDLTNSRPVHSLMLSSHLFLCLPCPLLPIYFHTTITNCDSLALGGLLSSMGHRWPRRPRGIDVLFTPMDRSALRPRPLTCVCFAATSIARCTLLQDSIVHRQQNVCMQSAVR